MLRCYFLWQISKVFKARVSEREGVKGRGRWGQRQYNIQWYTALHLPIHTPLAGRSAHRFNQEGCGGEREKESERRRERERGAVGGISIKKHIRHGEFLSPHCQGVALARHHYPWQCYGGLVRTFRVFTLRQESRCSFLCCLTSLLSVQPSTYPACCWHHTHKRQLCIQYVWK